MILRAVLDEVAEISGILSVSEKLKGVLAPTFDFSGGIVVSKTQNIQLASGEDKTILVSVRDEDDALIDITGYSCIWRIAYDIKHSNAVLSITGTVLDQTANPGQCQFVLKPIDTAKMFGRFFHGCWLTDGAGKKYRVMDGYLDVN